MPRLPAPKPGIVPLRPIGVGEILDGAFTAIRRNPRATLGVGAVIMTVFGIITALVAPSALTGFSGFSSFNDNNNETRAQLNHQLSNLGHQLAGLAVSYFVLFIAGQILTGMLTVVIGRAVLGEKVTAGQAWHRTLPRLAAIFGTTILNILILAAMLAVYAGIGVAILAATDGGGNGNAAPAVIYFVVVGIAVIIAFIWLAVSFMLANQVVVLERAGPVRALGRSWRLVRGTFWRVFGILLLADLIVSIASAVLMLPFSIPAGIISMHAGHPLNPPVAAVILGAIGTIVSRTVTGALLAGIYVLLYVDLRMRKEGLDMALRTAADGGPSGDEFATVWRPSSGSAAPGQSGPTAPGSPGSPAPGQQGPGHGQW